MRALLLSGDIYISKTNFSSFSELTSLILFPYLLISVAAQASWSITETSFVVQAAENFNKIIFDMSLSLYDNSIMQQFKNL